MHGISDDPKSQRSNYYKNSLIRKKKGLARSREVFSTINKKKAFITYHAILCFIDFKGNKNRFLPALETSLAAVILAIFSDKGQARPRN